MNEISRRRFLTVAGSSVSAAWLTTHWPEVVLAATHAREATQAGTPYKFQFLTSDEATEVDALSARIIPSGDGGGDKTPGAREAGVVYFIDQALMSFATGDQKKYRQGLPAIQAAMSAKFPGVGKFSAGTIEQQDQLLQEIMAEQDNNVRRRRQIPFEDSKAGTPEQSARELFEALRIHTISGFLIEPESGGNHDGVGWKFIGREAEHMFQPPFGYYDKDYPGWQTQPANASKK
jgi:gluconate 2-dehydrogenase gamma chain